MPATDLTKALTQAQHYQYELEREMNSVKTRERTPGVPIAKPRALLIYGRSRDWSDEHRLAQRLLNAGLSGIQVLTYDQVLHRAEHLLAAHTASNDVGPDGAHLDVATPEGDPFPEW